MTKKFRWRLLALFAVFLSNLWTPWAAAADAGSIIYQPEGAQCAVQFAKNPMLSINKEDGILYANWNSGKRRAQIQMVVSCGNDYEKALDDEGFCRQGDVWIEDDAECRKDVRDTRSKNWTGASSRYYQGGYFCRVVVAKSKNSGAYFKVEFCAADSQYSKVSKIFGRLEQLMVDDVYGDAQNMGSTREPTGALGSRQ
mgnify:FL=1